MEEELVLLIKHIVELAPRLWQAARQAVLASMIKDAARLAIFVLATYICYKGSIYQDENVTSTDREDTHLFFIVLTAVCLGICLVILGDTAYKLMALDWHTIKLITESLR